MLTIMTWKEYIEAWKEGEYGLAIILFMCIFFADLVAEGSILALSYKVLRGVI